MGTWNIFLNNFFFYNQAPTIGMVYRANIKYFYRAIFFLAPAMFDFLHENIAAFSQLALIECTTDGDFEYFLGYGIEIFFSIKLIIRYGLKKKKIFCSIHAGC